MIHLLISYDTLTMIMSKNLFYIKGEQVMEAYKQGFIEFMLA